MGENFQIINRTKNILVDFGRLKVCLITRQDRQNHVVIKPPFSRGNHRRSRTTVTTPCECSEILDLIDELFHLERLATGYDDLKKLREEKSRPLVKKIGDWLFDNQPKARGESRLFKAIQYTLNHWKGLTLFLKDVRIPLSNNEAERTIRHSVMGRKNFYGGQFSLQEVHSKWLRSFFI